MEVAGWQHRAESGGGAPPIGTVVQRQGWRPVVGPSTEEDANVTEVRHCEAPVPRLVWFRHRTRARAGPHAARRDARSAVPAMSPTTGVGVHDAMLCGFATAYPLTW